MIPSDYLTLLLTNMVAGFFLLAFYLLCSTNEVQSRKWAAPFGVVGLVALIGGFHMIFAWPLPGGYNSAFGETSVLLGGFFARAALALALEWDPLPMGYYGFFGGIAAIVLGISILKFKLTAAPMLSGVGFIISGAVGVGVLPALALRNSRVFRGFIAALAIVAGIIWAMTGYMSYYKHMQSYHESLQTQTQTK